MSCMTKQAEMELTLLAGQLRRAIEEMDAATEPGGLVRWDAERARLQRKLGERAAILLPVLLDELRQLRSSHRDNAD
jgi:hypothetical protein